MTCDNCGAEVAALGLASDGRRVCCPACIFNPLGCRCQFGEFGVPQEEDWEPDDAPAPAVASPETQREGA